MKRIFVSNYIFHRLRTYLFPLKLWLSPSWWLIKICKNNASQDPNIAIITSVGSHTAVTTLDSLLGVALSIRKSNVKFLLCDGVLAACEALNFHTTSDFKSFADNGVLKSTCEQCLKKAIFLYRFLGIPVHKYSDYINQNILQSAKNISANIDIKTIRFFTWKECTLGEHAYAGALRFFAKADITDEPSADLVLRHYLYSAIISFEAVSAFIEKNNIRIICCHHGIYIPQGIVGMVARQKKIRVVNWVVAYRKKRFIFSHDDTYHHTLLSESISTWENIKWNKSLDEQLMNYLLSRWHGSYDWIKFHDRSITEWADISKDIHLDFSKPTIGLLTNVAWDAQIHYPANAFSNMFEWLFTTINFFINNPSVNLVIRVHPAELKGIVSRQTVIEEVTKKFPNLPSNIALVGPTSGISTYALMKKCNNVIIYGTKTGVELSCLGIPVIVAGEAWLRNKGISIDIQSKDHYQQILKELPLANKLSDETVLRAKKYAFHFFFRRMIPILSIDPTDGFPPFAINLKGIKDIFPGQDKGLDVICSGIINCTPFIYTEEEQICAD